MTAVLSEPIVVWIPKDKTPCAEDPDLWFSDLTSHIEETRNICHSCLVKEICLEQALKEEVGVGPTYRYGVRGGLTGRQRYRLSAKNNRKC